MRFAIKSPDAELPSICRWLTSSCQGRSGRLNLNLKSGKSSWNFDHIPRKHISPLSIPTDALKMSLSHLQHIACNGQTTHHESLHLWKEAKVSSYCSYSHAWRHMPSSRAEELWKMHQPLLQSPGTELCLLSQQTADPAKYWAIPLSHANPPGIWVCSQAYWSDSSRWDVDCVSWRYKASKKTSTLQGNRDGTRNSQVPGLSKVKTPGVLTTNFALLTLDK